MAGPHGTTPARDAAGPEPRRALVPIGLNKAGSTTIQTWLGDNVAALRAQGATYEAFPSGPGGFGHAHGFVAVPLARAGVLVPSLTLRRQAGIAGLDDQAALARAFEDRAVCSFAGMAAGTYVVSSEYLAAWLRDRERIEALDAWLRAHFNQVGYVVYLRNQVDWIPSAFAQSVLTGGTASLEEFIARHGRYDYHALARRWVEAVGPSRLQVRLLERNFLTGGDLVADLAGLIGVDAGRTAPPRRMNEALSAPGVGLLRQANRIAARLEPWGGARARTCLLGLVTRLDRGPRLRLAPADAARVAALNEAGNEALRRWLFPSRPTLFSAARLGGGRRGPPTGVAGGRERE